MTEIAFASGFASVRRFNEAFVALFKRAPRELRRLAGEDLALKAGGSLSLLLRYQPPYDWPSMLEFLRQRAIPGMECVLGDRYSRTVDVDDAQGSISVEPSTVNALCAHIRVAHLSSVPAVIARLRRLFDLAADTLAISRHLAKDPVLAPLIEQRPGLRVPGAWDGFELSIRAVLGQQVSVAAAVRLATRLVVRYGEPLAAPAFGLTHLFPRPEALAHADLTQLGMPKSRAATLSAVAKAVLDDPELFSAAGALEQSVQRLRAIAGVGEWTAQYIALRQMREPDAFPASDLAVRRALADEHGRRPNADQVLARAERWQPWRAYAAQHLWAASAKG